MTECQTILRLSHAREGGVVERREDVAKTKFDTRLKRARKKLENCLSELDEKRRDIAQNLIENAAFMAVTLEDLSDKIAEDGTTSKYQNGENQWGTKKSPEVDVYNTMIKNYTTIIRTLCDLLPEGTQAESGLMQFLSRGQKGG